ncbi:MAG: hypothetical protein COB04_04375 [Gammaproteobacteria bacterium]|nr:MAG: hypothetical protein COB04_04375 [Gammaproteobacteria bacterium]
MRFLATLVLLMLLSGCVVFQAPVEGVEVKRVKYYQDIEGVYNNIDKGRVLSGVPWFGGRAPDLFLAHIVGSGGGRAKPKSMVKIDVTDEEVVFSEYEHGALVQSIKLVIDEDIGLKGDSLVLHKEKGFNDVFVGFYGVIESIGLDENDNLRYRRDEWALGLIYLLFPFAFLDKNEAVFERLERYQGLVLILGE